MTATRALTVVAEIDPERRSSLDRALAALELALIDRDALGGLPDTHFTRLVVVDDSAGELPPLLVWESNHDGKLDDYLRKVVLAARAEIEPVFRACPSFPHGGLGDERAFLGWVHQHSLPAAAFYCAYPGVPRAQIENDRELHAQLRRHVDAERAALCKLAPVDIQRTLRERVRIEAPDLAIDPQQQGVLRRAMGPGGVGLGVLALAALAAIARTTDVLGAHPLELVLQLLFGLVGGALVLLGPALLLWYRVLRKCEASDPVDEYHRPVHDPRRLQIAEDHITQNQLTHIVDIKPGAFRLFTLRAVLFVINLLARYVFTKGHLGGITSIHFARWVILPDRRHGVAERRHRLLFFSNYDGSWESYLGEFIDRAASGLTAVWSNTKGFPRTEKLLRAGARDEEAFKQWTRDRQIPTQVWWSGVPSSTVSHLRDDISIRRHIDRRLSDEELDQWLRRL